MQSAPEGAFATNDSTIDAVIDDLKILLTSNYGDRPIHYDFGANLRSIVFEQSTGVLTKAEDLVLLAIEKWMPFVQVEEIQALNDTLDGTLGPNDLRIRLRFTVGQIEGTLDYRIRN